MPTHRPLITTTPGSSSMARASARLTASTSVTSATGGSLELVALAKIGAREFCIKMIEHGFRQARAHRQIARDSGFDALLALGRKPLLVVLAPRLFVDEIGS